jgi:acyl-[acyl carrier protein]--UDP-N-acetylglucosamine O-acyltransferase
MVAHDYSIGGESFFAKLVNLQQHIQIGAVVSCKKTF